MDKSLWIIKSSQRDSGTSGSFNITTWDPLEGKYELKWVGIPLSNYNVNSSNNIFLFTDNSTARTATITPGNYDTSTLPAALASAMNAANSGFQTYSVTYSATAGAFTITAGSAFSVNMSSGSNLASGITGFSTNTSSATSQTSNQVVNLGNTLAINIRIEGAANGTTDVKQNWSSFLIPVLGNQGTFLEYFSPETFRQYVIFDRSISVLRISLWDDNFNAISLNGNDWEMALEKL